MKKALIFTFLSMLLLGCRKDDKINTEEPLEPTEEDALVKTKGSWWKYQWYKIDSTGTENSYALIDCVYVVGDTLINGNHYTHYQGTDFGQSTSWLWRQDNGQILGANDKVFFDFTNETDTFSTYLSQDYKVYTINTPNTVQFSTPSGVHESYVTESHFYALDSTAFTACDTAWIKQEFFSIGPGKVGSQAAYTHQVKDNCTYYESRLSEYYIAE